MAVFKLYKFRDISLMERHLRGAVLGGRDPVLGFPGVVGKTLIFSSPAVVTVTLSAGASGDGLTFQELKTKIEAAVATVEVLALDKQLCIVEKTPSSGVAFSGGTALKDIGFDPAGATGKVYSYPDGVAPAAAPHYVTAYPMEGHHVLLVRE